MRREEARPNTDNGEWCRGEEPGEGTVREVMEHWIIKFQLEGVMEWTTEEMSTFPRLNYL